MDLIGPARWAAARTTWLAKRLWILTLVEIALLARRHWVRLEPEERRRLTELIRKSRARPSKLLTDSERRELEDLLDKLGHLELARDGLARAIPFGGSVVRRIPLPKREPRPEQEVEQKPPA